MSVIAAPSARGPRLGRRGTVAILGVGVAAALSVATFSNPRLAHAVSEGLSESVHGVETVAAMLAERSPGERPEGALAQLKHKRAAALHERALPKVRAPAPSAYEALAGPPPSPPVAPPPEAPLFATVAGGPTPIVPPVGGSSGGPPILSTIPGPGGGGGFTPPVQTTAEVPPSQPTTPTTPVPEPATWAMMILGLVLMGRALKRQPVAGPKPALE